MPVDVGDEALVVVVDEELVPDRVVPEEVAVPDEVDVLDKDVGAGPVPSRWYTFRRCPAPQYYITFSVKVFAYAEEKGDVPQSNCHRTSSNTPRWP